MANTTKERAITRVLRALARHFDVGRSRFGTLGGDGYELEVWRRLGVPLTNCWLIERDPDRARKLIARARAAHHYVGELQDFPKAFRSIHPEGTLDVFHWDLHKTVEPSARELRAVFPLIAASASRVLLVTCADQRRNRSLDEASVVNAWWEWFLGSANTLREFRGYLEAQNDRAQERGLTEAESVNAVTRELGVYLNLLLVMCDFRCDGEAVVHGQSMGLSALDRTRAASERGEPLDIAASFAGGREPEVTFLPDDLVRLVYYSRAGTAQRCGFRMRTIGMHVQRCIEPISLRDAARLLAQGVILVPFSVVKSDSKDHIRTVTVPAMRREHVPREGQKKEVVAMEATQGNGATEVAAPKSRVGCGLVNRIIEDVEAFVEELALRLRDLGHSTGAMDTLNERVTVALVQLRDIETKMQFAEEATHAQNRLREVLAAVTGKVGAAAHPDPAPSVTAPQPDPPAPEAPPPVPTADSAPAPVATNARSAEMTGAQRDELRLRLLRARAEGADAYAAEKAAIQRETGLNLRPIAGLIATTSGRFAPGFIKRVCTATPKGDARRALAFELQQLGCNRGSPLAQKAINRFLRR